MAEDEPEVEDDGTDPEPETEVEEGSDPSTDETDADTPETGTDPDEAQAADEPEDYRKLLDKFGGDKGKVANEFWQAKNALSAAAKEKRELEARLKELEGRTRQPAQPEKPAEPPQPHPDIKRLDERITAFSQRGTEIEAEQRQILIDLGNATVERQVRERQLKAGEEFLSPEVKAEMRAELRAWEAEEKRLQREFRQNELTKVDVQDRLDRLNHEKAFAAKHLEGEKARQEQAERERETFFEEFPQTIDQNITNICNELKVSDDKDIREFVWSSTYAHLVNLLSPYNGQGIASDQVDYEGVIKAHIERTMKVFDQIGRGAVGKLSKAKLTVSKPAGAPRPATTPSNPANPSQPYDRDSDPKLIAARQRLAERGL
jgi:hypothetical protein